MATMMKVPKASGRIPAASEIVTWITTAAAKV
jgi:hypothetical protein